MKRQIFIIISLLGIAIAANAVPARPGKFKYRQPDGSTLAVTLHGDEFGHWYVDESGNKLIADSKGFLKHVGDSEISRIRSNAAASRSAINRTRRVNRANTTGTSHIPVLVVQFQDVKFRVAEPATKFDNLLNQEGYTYLGATGSVRDFFVDNSMGQYTPSFAVFGPVTVSGNCADYGENEDVASIILEAAAQLDDEVDFSNFDGDGDGQVDMVLVYYAGYNEAEGGPSSTIWPHQYSVSSSQTFDGVRFGSYFCTSELKGNSGVRFCGPATTCHEFSHSLGLPDFYDTDYQDNGMAGGTYDFDTMCSGPYNNDGNTPPYFNAEERLMLGWLDEIVELPSRGNISLPAISNDSQIAYKSPSSISGEYFVYECRKKQHWDAHIPEEGLLVYHVDKSSTKVSIGNYSVTAFELWDNWGWYNKINANGTHPCFYIIPAAAQNYKSSSSYYGDPSSGLNYAGNAGYTFGADSDYNSYTPVDWSGKSMNYGLVGIAYANGVAGFHINNSSRFNYIYPGKGNYAPGDEFVLDLIFSEADPPVTISWYYDGTAVSADSVTLTSGTHVVSAQLTLASGASQTVEFELEVK